MDYRTLDDDHLLVSGRKHKILRSAGDCRLTFEAKGKQFFIWRLKDHDLGFIGRNEDMDQLLKVWRTEVLKAQTKLEIRQDGFHLTGADLDGKLGYTITATPRAVETLGDTFDIWVMEMTHTTARLRVTGEHNVSWMHTFAHLDEPVTLTLKDRKLQ